MKNLIYKEVILCTNVQIVLFAIFSLFILIPTWPPAVAFVYPLSGLLSLFPRCLANKDIEYTALLPIKKTDVVKGKALYIGLVEIAVILLAAIGGLIRLILYKEPTNPDALNYFIATKPTISLFGFVFLSFGIMNWVILGIYYRNPYKKLAGPNLISLLACILLLTIGSVIIAFVPSLREYNALGLILQLSTLSGGIILFILFTFLGYISGAKAFTKIDL